MAPYAAVAQRLGFQVLVHGNTQPAPDCYSPAMLDFGPSVAHLVGAELGVEDNGLPDFAARDLVEKGGRVSLSKLERSSPPVEAYRSPALALLFDPNSNLIVVPPRLMSCSSSVELPAR